MNRSLQMLPPGSPPTSVLADRCRRRCRAGVLSEVVVAEVASKPCQGDRAPRWTPPGPTSSRWSARRRSAAVQKRCSREVEVRRRWPQRDGVRPSSGRFFVRSRRRSASAGRRNAMKCFAASTFSSSAPLSPPSPRRSLRDSAGEVTGAQTVPSDFGVTRVPARSGRCL